MKKILFVNGCIRENSRTEALARAYLARQAACTVEEIRLEGLDIRPFDYEMLQARDRASAGGDFSGGMFSLARQFADADQVVIAAPYWDCLFPSKLKVYLEHVSVNGVTFAYGPEGRPEKRCRAESLVYITTAGGFLQKPSSVEYFIREYCGLLCIEDVRFYAAEGLDVFPDRVQPLLDDCLAQMS